MDAASEEELTASGVTRGNCAQTLIRTLKGAGKVRVDATPESAPLRSAYPYSTDALAGAVSAARFELTAVRKRAR